MVTMFSNCLLMHSRILTEAYKGNTLPYTLLEFIIRLRELFI